MFQPEINKDFTPIQIAWFILHNDKDNIFASARLNIREFIRAIKRLDENNLIIVFREGDEIQGVLGWYFVTEETKHLASKATWRLPEVITEGDILYLSFIETKGNCDIVAIKTMFEKMGYRQRVKKRRGFTKGRWYEHKIKRS